MCGRFTQAYTRRELYELYRLTCPPANLEPRYNIAPTHHDRCGGAARDRPRSPIDALKPDPVMVEEDGQGSAVDFQRPRRDGRQQADVSHRLQARALPDPGKRLLRMAADAGRKAAILHQRGGRLPALDGRALGSMDRRRDGRTRAFVPRSSSLRPTRSPEPFMIVCR
jgi:hypothetical protein